MENITRQNYQFPFSPSFIRNEKDSKENQKGLRTLSQIRDCKSYYQLFGACLDAKKSVFNHLSSYLHREDKLSRERKSRRVYDDDIRLFFQPEFRFKPIREKMATWSNIKAPSSVEKLPLYREIRRVIRLLLIRNKNVRERREIRFNPRYECINPFSNGEIFLSSLGYYVFDMLKREDLLLVYKDKLLELFRRESCRMTAIGYRKFVEETKELYPESFYDKYAHYKCFDSTLSKGEKIKAARDERKDDRMKIVENFFKLVINPNVAGQYFKKTGGNKPKLLCELNKRLEKNGFKPIKERTLNSFKSKIFKQYGINIKEILSADKSLYKEHTAVRKEFTRKRMTMKERVDIIHFVLKGKDPSEMDVVAYYSQHLPPWRQIRSWSIPIDDYYPS